MKFSIGYQLPDPDEEPFSEIVSEFREHIAEVYFPWLAVPSGRSPLTTRDGFVDWAEQARLESDLAVFKKMGLKLNLLLNGNCYGAASLSRQFEHLIISIIERLAEVAAVDIVTTSSLMVARALKRHFPKVHVRASVNMRIGTIKGMEYVSEYFDGYCMQREYNRDLKRIDELCRWTRRHGKELQILFNSGCLNFCSGQVFHDNLVAHEAEISGVVNVKDFNPSVCWSYYADKAHWATFLQNSWVRPEDVGHYEAWFPVGKLATRMHGNPRKVIQAYSAGRFYGNLIDLLEPGHNPIFSPFFIDNTAFPPDWFEKTTSCDKKCENCSYCANVLKLVLKSA